jgi:tetratricopeptide (TPR) repeat protein
MQVRTWSTAERLWGHALTVEPANALAANNLGWHLMNHQRWAEAEPLFAAAVALEPRSAKFALNEGVALERTRGADEALTFYARALQSLPTVAELHFNRGLILARQGRHAEARAALEQASVLNPEWAAPRQQLARSAREGMPDRAKADGRPPL